MNNINGKVNFPWIGVEVFRAKINLKLCQEKKNKTQRQFRPLCSSETMHKFSKNFLWGILGSGLLQIVVWPKQPHLLSFRTLNTHTYIKRFSACRCHMALPFPCSFSFANIYLYISSWHYLPTSVASTHTHRHWGLSLFTCQKTWQIADPETRMQLCRCECAKCDVLVFILGKMPPCNLLKPSQNAKPFRRFGTSRPKPKNTGLVFIKLLRADNWHLINTLLISS